MGFWRRDKISYRKNSGDVGVRMDAISGDADVNRPVFWRSPVFGDCEISLRLGGKSLFTFIPSHLAGGHITRFQSKFHNFNRISSIISSHIAYIAVTDSLISQL